MIGRFPDQLLIFAKPPRPGLAKTRLANTMGAEGAAGAYRALLDRLVDNLQEVPRVIVRHTPDEAGPEMKAWLRPGWRLEPQGPGNLGARLERAFAACFTQGCGTVVIIGSDCPYVEPADLVAAESSLDRTDVVLGPAHDGGYWLIGMRALHAGLLRGIPWSTPAVLSETRRRAEAEGLAVGLLRELEDVDTVEAWERFKARANVLAPPPEP